VIQGVARLRKEGLRAGHVPNASSANPDQYVLAVIEGRATAGSHIGRLTQFLARPRKGSRSNRNRYFVRARLHGRPRSTRRNGTLAIALLKFPMSRYGHSLLVQWLRQNNSVDNGRRMDPTPAAALLAGEPAGPPHQVLLTVAHAGLAGTHR
jgi:hypothetical protein